MSSTKFDSRQVISRDTLNRIALATDTELDDLLRSLNAEVTPPLNMSASATPDLILNIGNISVQNPLTLRNRVVPHIGGLIPSFASGTVEFPSTSGGTITVTPGLNGILTVPSNEYIKVTVYLDANGDLGVLPGAPNAVEASATILPAPSGTFAIGYVTLFNNAGTIDNVVDTNIFQFVGGGGGGSGSGDANEFIADMKHRLVSGNLELFVPIVFSISEDAFVDGASTGSYSLVDGSFVFSGAAETFVSTDLIDPAFAGNVTDVEIHLDWIEGQVDDAAVVEASLDGGSSWSAVTMARLATTERFSGRIELAPTTIAAGSFLQEKDIVEADSNLPFEDTGSGQKYGQKFTLTEDTTIDEMVVWINKAGSPSGNFTINIYGNDVGNNNLPDEGNVIWTSANQDITALIVGTTEVTVLPDQFLAAGIYHLVVDTDATYKASQVNGLTEIRWRTDSTGVPWTQASRSVYNGTSWDGNAPPDFPVAVHRIEGTIAASSEPEDLRVRVTASQASQLGALAAHYGNFVGSAISGNEARQVFSVNGDDDQTEFVITKFLPDVNVMKVYDRSSGLVYMYPDFDIDGYTVTFAAGQFSSPGETFNVIFDQSEGGGFDNADANAALLAANGLGSADPNIDKSAAGVGPKMRSPNGTLWTLRVLDDGSLVTEEV